MAPSAADVPSKFDILIDGKGYVYHDAFTGGSSSNVPEKGIFTYTPTFVPRQNIQGNYGDNQQDFWLTFSQNDWSLGEGQRYQGRIDDSLRKYFSGDNIDIVRSGRVAMRSTLRSITTAAAVQGAGRYTSFLDKIAYVTSTNMYTVEQDGTISDFGAHSITSGSIFGVVTDGNDNYVAGGANKLRKRSSGTFSDFNITTTPTHLAYLNNTLYGISLDTLWSYSTSGTETTLFAWKQVDGGAITRTYYPEIVPYGGKLLIAFGDGSEGAELWIYDGTGVSRLATLPPNFGGCHLAVASGIVFVGGHFYKRTSGGNYLRRPAIMYYANGTLGLLWQADSYASSGTSLPANDEVAVAPWENGIAFADNLNGKLMYYDIPSGSISTLSTFTPVTPAAITLASSSTMLFLGFATGTTAYLFPHNTTTATSSTVSSSLIDFDSSLTKLFRGIKVEFDDASDGDGGTLDIAYRLGDVDGSYTTVQSDATSGTEYTLSGVTGRSISIKITLNRGTSTSGPVLKRVYLRAVPVQQNFERFKVVLNCTGRAEPGVNDPQYIELRDGSIHNKDGLQMATDLRSAAESTSPISVTTKFGTLSNCIIEDLSLSEIRPNEFVGEATVREV